LLHRFHSRNALVIRLKKKVNESKSGNDKKGGGPKPPQKPGEKKPEEMAKDTTQTKEKVNYAKIIGNGFLKLLMSFKRASLSYTEGNGIFMPGFLPQPGMVGNNWSSDAPGLGFVFGSQADLRYEAVAQGWLTTDTLLNTAYITKYTQQISFRGSIEPVPDFKVEITADRTYSLNHQEYFKADANGQFKSFSPVEQGSFNISFFSWPTAWAKDNDKDESPNFIQLKDNRLTIAERLARSNPNWNEQYEYDSVTQMNFPVGYGPTQQDVLTYSFLTAYSGKDPGSYTLEMMPKIPKLNWRVTYNGLSKVEIFKKYLRNVTITHGYKSTSG